MHNDTEINQQYWRILRDIMEFGHPVTCRGRKTRELCGCKSIIDLDFPVVTRVARKLNYQFMAAEAAWILSGSSRVEELAKYVSRMRDFSDDGIRLQGAYGPMFTEQVRYVVDALKHDQMTRQAVMTFWRSNPRESRDIPCTVSLQFLIRHQKLNCFTNMRSSDAWLGWPYDVFSFSMIAHYVRLSVDATIMPGQLHLSATSQHIYEQNYADVERVIGDSEVGTTQAISTIIYNGPEGLYQCLCDSRDCPTAQYPLCK